jgi:hypothetical protein
MKKEKPKWLMSYSFICLKNLPDVISSYGPLSLYWEGGGLGEKVLQQFKIIWNTLKDVYQHVELIRIGADLKEKRKTTCPNFFHIYSDYITVRNTFMQNKPMSVVGMKDGIVGVAFGVNNNGSFSIIPLCLESFVIQQMALSYFEFIPKYKAI